MSVFRISFVLVESKVVNLVLIISIGDSGFNEDEEKKREQINEYHAKNAFYENSVVADLLS